MSKIEIDFKLSLNLLLGIIPLTYLLNKLTKNFSTVDRLWSIVPVIYSWTMVYDFYGIMMSILITLWGIRLSYNFYRKGNIKK
jgi:steroid 5-alpha reductase family enzyme